MLRRVVPHLRTRELYKGGEYEGGLGGEEKGSGKGGRQEEEAREGRSTSTVKKNGRIE